MISDRYISIMLIFCMLAILVGLIIMIYKVNEYDAKLDAFKESRNLRSDQFIGGYYFDEDYLCVYPAGLSKKEYDSFLDHESCHALVDLEFKHFCLGDNVTSFKRVG